MNFNAADDKVMEFVLGKCNFDLPVTKETT
jgi:hypothetical protein